MVNELFEGRTLTVSGWRRRDQSEFAIFLGPHRLRDTGSTAGVMPSVGKPSDGELKNAAKKHTKSNGTLGSEPHGT